MLRRLEVGVLEEDISEGEGREAGVWVGCEIRYKQEEGSRSIRQTRHKKSQESE